MALTSAFGRRQPNAEDVRQAAAERERAALERELAGYEASGKKERADQVRAELRRRGVETTAQVAPETATQARGRKRAS